MVMRKHQRYLPVYDAGGSLMPLFITVANGNIHPQTVIAGSLPLLNHLSTPLPKCWGCPQLVTQKLSLLPN